MSPCDLRALEAFVLDPVADAGTADHLRGCPKCAEELTRIRALRSALTARSAQDDGGLEAIRAGVERRLHARRSARARRRGEAPFVFAFAALLVCLGGAIVRNAPVAGDPPSSAPVSFSLSPEAEPDVLERSEIALQACLIPSPFASSPRRFGETDVCL